MLKQELLPSLDVLLMLSLYNYGELVGGRFWGAALLQSGGIPGEVLSQGELGLPADSGECVAGERR